MGTFALISLLLSVVGMGVSAAMENRANQQNYENAEKLNEQQYEFSRESAETANEQTRQNYWELYSPQAKVQQYKEAGLSPALMYSMGGVSGTGQAAAQELQPNVQLPTMNPLLGTNLSEMMSGLSKAAEIDLTKAEELNTLTNTEKQEEEIKNLKKERELWDAEIDNILKDIEVKNSEVNLNNVRVQNEAFDGVLKQYEIQYQQATIGNRIQIVEETLKNLENTNKKLIEEINGLNIDNKYKEKLINAQLRKYAAETSLIWKQGAYTEALTFVADAEKELKEAQTKLTKEQKFEARQHIANMQKQMQQIQAQMDLWEKQGEKIELEKVTEVIGWITAIRNEQRATGKVLGSVAKYLLK